MRKALIVLVLGAILGLSSFGGPAAASPTATPATVSTPASLLTQDSSEGARFLDWLNGQEPVLAAACTTSVRCYSTGQLLSCSGSTCFRFNGCSVTCDGVEYNCPPGGPFACP